MADIDPRRQTDSSVTRTPIETVLKYIDYYNAPDTAGMKSLMSPDFTRVGSSQWARPMQRDAYSDMSRRWNDAFDETNWELIDMVASGESVVCEFIESGIMARPWAITDDRVIQPNGERYMGRATVWFTVNAAGLIHTYRYYSDEGFGVAYGKEIAASGTAPLVTPAEV
jgi:SnoaL-like domain